jgi:hypothetical protein
MWITPVDPNSHALSTKILELSAGTVVGSVRACACSFEGVFAPIPFCQSELLNLFFYFSLLFFLHTQSLCFLQRLNNGWITACSLLSCGSEVGHVCQFLLLSSWSLQLSACLSTCLHSSNDGEWGLHFSGHEIGANISAETVSLLLTLSGPLMRSLIKVLVP